MPDEKPAALEYWQQVEQEDFKPGQDRVKLGTVRYYAKSTDEDDLRVIMTPDGMQHFSNPIQEVMEADHEHKAPPAFEAESDTADGEGTHENGTTWCGVNISRLLDRKNMAAGLVSGAYLAAVPCRFAGLLNPVASRSQFFWLAPVWNSPSRQLVPCCTWHDAGVKISRETLTPCKTVNTKAVSSSHCTTLRML